MGKEYKVSEVLVWLKRYGPLCEYLEEFGAYGDFMVIMHGRVPRKVGRVGKMVQLEVLDEEFTLNLDI
jgi:hypothetical protein